MMLMEYLVIAILVATFLWMGTGNKSYRRKTNAKGRKTPTLGPRKQIKKYDFDPQYFNPFEGSAHVIDGDTIVVKGQKIRLAGVNAPELDQAWGQKSKWEMVKILKGKIVHVVPNGETSFDRIVATCYIDGDTDIGAELISRGLARDIPAFTGGKYKKYETGAGRRRVKPTPYNNNAAKHPLVVSDETPKEHQVIEIKLTQDQLSPKEDDEVEISLVEKWDDEPIKDNIN